MCYLCSLPTEIYFHSHLSMPQAQTIASLWYQPQTHFSPSIKILTIFSQMGCNHVYKLLYLVTYMGPSNRFVYHTISWFHYYAIPWNLVQHSTSYSFKYTHCLLFMILINILRGVYAHSNLLLYSKTKYQLITNFCTHVIPLFTKHCIRINVF